MPGNKVPDRIEAVCRKIETERIRPASSRQRKSRGWPADNVSALAPPLSAHRRPQGQPSRMLFPPCRCERVASVEPVTLPRTPESVSVPAPTVFALVVARVTVTPAVALA